MLKQIRPPLPFLGHKGAWNDELNSIASRLPSGCVVVDVFGGSGVCAHVIKKARPDLRVVWNDYDNYRARLDHIAETNILRARLSELLGERPPKNGFLPPLPEETKTQALNILRGALDEFGFLDHITAARWLSLYPSKGARLFDSYKKFNCVPLSPYNVDACRAWCSDVERACASFVGLDTEFKTEGGAFHLRDLDASRAFLILDPPYLSTNRDEYQNKESLKVFRSIIECVRALPFALFGDESITFWYEILLESTPCERFTKQYKNSGRCVRSRSDVCFVHFPDA